MTPQTRFHFGLAGALVALAAIPPAAAQPPGGASTPVRVTAAVSFPVRGAIELTGAVNSRRSSLVATEIEGLIEELAAREGDRVRRGDLLARLRRTPVALRLQAAEGQLSEALARRELAAASLERYRGLWEEKIVSRQQLDDAVSEREAWQGRVSQLEADVARLRDELERTAVRAPFSGVVVEEHVAVGEWVGSGGAIVELVDLEDLEVTVEVPEGSFAGVEPGGPARIRLAALGGLEVEGKIRAVVPRADDRARTFPVKVGIPNPQGRIGVGMLAQVSLPVGAPREAVIVPKDAVVDQLGEKFVFVVDGEGGLRREKVLTGSSTGAWIAVRGEVGPGDRVVTRGNERVFPGMQVEAEPLEYELP